MPFNRHILKVITVIAVAALVLVARFLMIDPALAMALIAKYGYWMVAITFVGFAALLARQLPAKDEVWKLCEAHRAGLFCILLAGVYLQVNEPREFKILYDEVALSGVARNMHFDRQATYPGRSHYFNGGLLVMETGVDKRPFFFPFIISLVHDITGYRPENVFYLNAGLAVILLLLVYAFGVASGGTRLGCLGVLILTGLPLIAQNATAGGDELANLAMILLLYFSGRRYYRSPGTQGLNLFILTAILLAQVRSESILYALVVPALVLSKWCQEEKITLTWMAAISPALLIMPLLANEVFSAIPGHFHPPPGQPFLSLQYLLDNSVVAIYYMFCPNLGNTNSVLLSMTGLFGAVYFLFLTGRNIKQWFFQRADDLVLFAIFVITCINTALVLGVSWGHWDDPVASRLSLPLQLFMLVLMLRSTARLLGARPLPKWTLGLAGMWIVLFTAPASARLYQTNRGISALEYSWLFGYLAHKDPATTLTMCGSVTAPVLYNMPAIAIDRAREVRWKIKTCLDEGIYREIIVLQRFKIDYKSGKYLETGPARLGEGFKLETMAEKGFHPGTISRISRVVDVDLAGIPKPSGFEKRTKFINSDDYDLYLLSQFP
jgi:hypothetical protein